jgi:hypothetical protein
MSEQTNGGNSAPSSPAAAAAATGKGPSLITIVGIIGLVVLFGVLIYAIPQLKKGMDNPVVKAAVDIYPDVTAMKDMTQSQISDQAEKHTANELKADPTGLSGRYVQVEGDISRDESMLIAEQIAINTFNDADRPTVKGAVLDDGLVFLDITGELPDLSEGTRIRGFGKVLQVKVADIFELPWVGPDLEQEFGSHEAEEVVIFLSKGYQLVAPAQGTEEVDDSQKKPTDPATPADAADPTAPASPEGAEGAEGAEAAEGGEGEQPAAPEGEAEGTETPEAPAEGAGNGGGH